MVTSLSLASLTDAANPARRSELPNPLTYKCLDRLPRSKIIPTSNQMPLEPSTIKYILQNAMAN